jgi:hypothetical protein
VNDPVSVLHGAGPRLPHDDARRRRPADDGDPQEAPEERALENVLLLFLLLSLLRLGAQDLFGRGSFRTTGEDSGETPAGFPSIVIAASFSLTGIASVPTVPFISAMTASISLFSLSGREVPFFSRYPVSVCRDAAKSPSSRWHMPML